MFDIDKLKSLESLGINFKTLLLTQYGDYTASPKILRDLSCSIYLSVYFATRINQGMENIAQSKFSEWFQLAVNSADEIHHPTKQKYCFLHEDWYTKSGGQELFTQLHILLLDIQAKLPDEIKQRIFPANTVVSNQQLKYRMA